MDDLSRLPNIGRVLAGELASCGIASTAMLMDLGTLETAWRLKQAGFHVCAHKAYAIEGAIQGIRWHHLSRGTKNRIRLETNRFINSTR